MDRMEVKEEMRRVPGVKMEEVRMVRGGEGPEGEEVRKVRGVEMEEVRRVRGVEGDLWMRCRGGGGSLAHSSLLASTSHLLRTLLGECEEVGEKMVVVVEEEEQEEVDNLLDLLYTGAARQTDGLASLMDLLQIEFNDESFIKKEEKESPMRKGKNHALTLPQSDSVKIENHTDTKESNSALNVNEDEVEVHEEEGELKVKQALKKFECSHCGKKLKTLVTLEVHTKNFHQTSETKSKKKRRTLTAQKENVELSEPAQNPTIDVSALAKKINEKPTKKVTKLIDLKLNRCFICEHCKALLTNLEGLKTHTKTTHPEHYQTFEDNVDLAPLGTTLGHYKCSECPEGFDRPLKFIDHILRHQNGTESFNCESCSFICGSVSKLKKHMSEHMSKEVLCTECGRNFVNNARLKMHKTWAHSEVRSHQTKSIIEKEESIKPRLKGKRKIKTKKAVGKSHICDTCANVFTNFARYNRHLLLHEEPQFVCTHCGRKFHHNTRLTLHIRNIHTEHHNKKFQCNQCEKGFNFRVTLNNHMNVHLGLKPYKCRHCDNCYQNSENRAAHERKRHIGLFTIPFKPNFCVTNLPPSPFLAKKPCNFVKTSSSRDAEDG